MKKLVRYVDMKKIQAMIIKHGEKFEVPFPVVPVFDVAVECDTHDELRDAILDLRADKTLFGDACTFFRTYFGMSLVSLTICLEYEKQEAV